MRPAVSPSLIPLTCTPVPMPLPTAPLAVASTKRSWNDGWSPATASFMLAMLSETASSHVRYTVRPEPAVLMAPKSTSALHRRAQQTELGVHGLDHGLVLEVGVDGRHRLVVEADVVLVRAVGLGRLGRGEADIADVAAVAAVDGAPQAALEVDVGGLEAGRLHVGDVVGRSLLPGRQPLHRLVDDVHGAVGQHGRPPPV